MAKFLKLLVAIPIGIVIVAFAIANRQIVSVSFDPFSAPTVSTIVIAAPLFLLLFIVLLVGTFVGGVAAWLAQGRHRRHARDAREEAERWREEARRLREQPPVVVAPSRQLVRRDA